MPLQFGIWSPVCGGWLRVVNHEANLSTQDLVKLAANLGLSAQLVGDRYTIIQRLKEYEAVGVDLTSSVGLSPPIL